MSVNQIANAKVGKDRGLVLFSHGTGRGSWHPRVAEQVGAIEQVLYPAVKHQMPPMDANILVDLSIQSAVVRAANGIHPAYVVDRPVLSHRIGHVIGSVWTARRVGVACGQFVAATEPLMAGEVDDP